ncbi:MAG: hypothetical protein DI626_02855 [Micavibrio aeruginosavorus]|uniref:Uncharacterized protein n=1 Tax=Micavibrio aeruginosavorus TaxID=349221 RepID=A0A2W5BY33_9BACT|nr:MAG: hypothetical protein DI626_02855 [Micavibrio aeruginosavorus]
MHLYVRCDEPLSVGIPKVGHIGFSLENGEGQKRYFDYGMIGALTSKDRLSRIFTKSCLALPIAGIALYSGGAAALTASSGGTSPVSLLAGAYAGALYGSVLGLGVSACMERDKPLIENPTKTLSLGVTQAQHDDMLAYARKKKYSFYSVAMFNCVTHVEDMMRKSGVETPGAWSGIFTLPGSFIRKMERLHTQDGPSLQR